MCLTCKLGKWWKKNQFLPHEKGKMWAYLNFRITPCQKRDYILFTDILLLCFLILGGHSDPHKPMFFLYFDHRFFPAHKLMHHNLDSMQYQNSEQATSKVYHINLFQYMLISPMKIAFNLCMDMEYLPKHNKKVCKCVCVWRLHKSKS